jgi:hypothetical protein
LAVDLLLIGLSGASAVAALLAGLVVVFGSLQRRRAGSPWTGRLSAGLALVLVGGFATSWLLFLLAAAAW